MRPTIQVGGDFGDVDKKVAAIAAALKGLSGKARIDTAPFLTSMAKMDVALADLRKRLGNLRMDATDTKFLAKLYGAKGVVNSLAEQLEHLDADGDTNKLISKIYGVKATVEDLETLASHIDVNGDVAKMEAKIATLVGGARDLSHELSDMRANIDDAGAIAKILTLQEAVLQLTKRLRNLPVSADTLPIEASLFKLKSQIEALKKSAGDIQVRPEVVMAVGGPAKGSPAQFASLGKVANTGGALGAYASMSKIAGADVNYLSKALRETGPSAGVANAALARLAATDSVIIKSNLGGWMGAAGTKIRLFGGALDSVLPKFTRAISIWHLAADVAFEFAAAWVPALIAVGTFAAYAIPTGQKIISQWKNINTILDGVGSSTLPDLGRQFDQVQRAIQPSILIAYGEYMQTVGRNGSALGTVLAGTGHVIDKWGASFVMWIDKAQKGFNNLARSGTTDFALIGEGFHQLFRIIGLIIQDMPGIVHVLLPAGDAFLKLVGNVIQALGPVLKFGLLLHGVIIYAGLAATAVLALGRAISVSALSSFLSKTGGFTVAGEQAVVASGKFNKMGSAIGALAGTLAAGAVNTGRYGKSLFAIGDDAAKVGVKARLGAAGSKLFGDALKLVTLVPVAGWVAVAAVAIGVGLYFALRRTADAADHFQKSMNALIATSNFLNIQQHFQVALQQTSDKLAQQNAALKNWGGVAAAASGKVARVPQQLANQVHDLQTYKDTLLQVAGQAQNYGARLNDLVPLFGSTGAAQNALNLAGIKASDVAKETNAQWQSQLIQLKGLAAGYGYMGNQIGAAGAQLSALNITSGTTYKNVQALTQAETGWISLITGGTQAFTSFEQGQNTLNSTLKKGAASGTTINVTLGKLRQSYSAVGASMKGTSAGALAAQQAFAQQLTAGTTLWGNLQTLSTASGNTAASQRELAKSGRDIVAQMLPFVAGNKQATAQLSALAQLMGGPATSSFQVLAKWVGSTKGAEGDLYSQQGKLTISAANLTVAAKNLGNALETNLAGSEAVAIAKTFGLNQAIQGLAGNVGRSGHAINAAAVSLAGEYVSALRKSGMSTQDATQNLNAYLARLGYTPGQIKTLDAAVGVSAGMWNKYEATVNQNASAQKAFQKATAATGTSFKNLSTNFQMGSTAANALWHALVKQDAGMVASSNHATAAKKAFIEFAKNGLGVSAANATALWSKFSHQNLDQLANKAANTKKAFIDFAIKGLHLSQADAQNLWKAFAQQNLDQMVTKGDSAKKSFIDLAVKGLNLASSQATNLWDTLKRQYLDTLANKAGETRAAFERTARQFGLTKAQADNLWGSLHKLASGSPYGINVNETLTGKGKLTAAVTGTAVTIASTAAGAASQGNIISASNAVGKAAGGLKRHHAAGWLVPPGASPAGVDGHHAVLAPGELVIPTSHAPAHLAQAKREGIPGIPAMASGGIAGGFPNWNNVASAASAGVPMMAKSAEQVTTAAVKQWVGNINNKFQSQQAATGGGAGGFGALTGGNIRGLLGIAKYLLTQGFNKAAAAGVAATISGESGGNPESRNCVPFTYKVVTHRGILSHDEVRAGDRVPGYNLETGRLEVAYILDVPYHYGAQMCRIGNKSWSAVCTVDHKWITQRGLVRADRLTYEDKVMLGDGWHEVLDSYERLPDEDTFCLTTTTGTWTVMPDNSETPVWTGNSGGWGLIGWTGNTVGLPPGYGGPTGNVAHDMAAQLAGVVGYARARGGIGAINAAGNAVAAGNVWSRYEAPLVPLSDTRPSVANALFSQLAGGGLIPGGPAVKRHSAGGMLNEPVFGVGKHSGLPYSFAERSSEYIGPISGQSHGGGMQGATNTGQKQVIALLRQLVKQNQALPNALGKSLAGGAGNGVRHGYYGIGN